MSNLLGARLRYDHVPISTHAIATEPRLKITTVGVCEAANETVAYVCARRFASALPLRADESVEHQHVGFDRGAVFYLKDNKVVGALLLNLEEEAETARALIERGGVLSDRDELKNTLKIDCGGLRLVRRATERHRAPTPRKEFNKQNAGFTMAIFGLESD